MNHRHKVVWSEGMFLRPQHFQQQERYLEHMVHGRVSALSTLAWGFTELELDEDALAFGSIVLRRASGVLPDGTPFNLPGDARDDLALDVPVSTRDTRVCLALPVARSGRGVVVFDADDKRVARYHTEVDEVSDVNSSGGEPVEMQTCRLRFRLMMQADVPEGWNALSMARVAERRANNLVVLDRTFIPPVVTCRANVVLDGFVREVAGLLNQRGETLAARLTSAGRGGVSEIGDFLLLQLVNQWQPLMLHLSSMEGVHPERLYSELLRLVGELSVFSDAGRRPTLYPTYRHDDLWESFKPVLLDLRRALAMVLEQSAVEIELDERKYGIRMAMVPDRQLFKSASFVIAVHANLPPEQIHAQFPTQVKIGPVEKIRDLVNLHLPGVPVKPLPIAPRELPYHAGYNYFELDSHHELWKEIERGAGLAIHIAGDFPGLELECWAIRR